MVERRKKERTNEFQFMSLFFILMIVIILVGSISRSSASIDKIPSKVDKEIAIPNVTATPTPTVTPTTNTSSNNIVKLAAFNLQIFGTSKADKPEVMEVLSKTIRNFDIVAVQEIRDASQTALPELRNALNDMAGSKYDFVVSERLTSKEQYAYLYNTEMVELIGTPYTYPEPTNNDMFFTEPYIAHLKVKNGSFDFVLINTHIYPDTATPEINHLPKVVEDAKSRYKSEDDFIVLGDLNADCSYFNENSQSPLRKSDYYWVIDNSVDTTIKSNNCTYDRIIITTPTINDYTGNSGVFKFDEAYNLDYHRTIAVSDHYPVYANFWSNNDTD